ncbi:TipAS antibiotic-recognition domain-containing protein [Polyangium sp. rjm3]|uniref:TipAS antibiotic-recognition domain-containing protein n=1 Tax=Polyangium mundeleinium TaxID=2995306 RepID=A0ABT5EGK2_9BACT|nr:TipAS antibiotic-recognition domain-containing protein [Polyangium mundeleinium]MDC0740482.1 TipAS antibiotic-recognition domain-containing protein [Polyangium mundeleinium]
MAGADREGPRGNGEGYAAEDPAVQALAGRWMELVEMFTGGNPGIRQSLENMYKNEPGFAAQQGHDPALYDYVRRAQAARKGGTSV